MKCSALLSICLLVVFSAEAQTITMGKKCREKNESAQALLRDKKYEDALQSFQTMEQSCKTKDAKEATANGKAQALNGLQRYSEAITASDAALKLTKNTSLMGLFQKAVAQAGLKQFDEANATLSHMISLTEKNQDKKSRASNYALLSQLHWRQLNNMDSAYYFLDKAMTLDSANFNYPIQKGDMLVSEKKYDDAFKEYDKVIESGKADQQIYQVRTEARLKMMQEKYQTNNAQQLKEKMNASEKEQVCTDLNKAISLGLKDMKLDMFASLVCK